MRARDLKEDMPIRLPTGKVHRLRFGYSPASARDEFHRAARTYCGIRVGKSGYDLFTPRQCEPVEEHTVEDRSEFCVNCVPRWRWGWRDRFMVR